MEEDILAFDDEGTSSSEEYILYVDLAAHEAHKQSLLSCVDNKEEESKSITDKYIKTDGYNIAIFDLSSRLSLDKFKIAFYICNDKLDMGETLLQIGNATLLSRYMRSMRPNGHVQGEVCHILL
ncbi:hypothetical protein PanWU01x14_003630 [Parasponia andersonii]|uniref:Uncharacterized protein n=1 Tax=Parasponia andersonii TaxID=3476 RepID=A0A2P5E5I4_PARAD|nr:hypothetical protein PanWU01x14_003630 [Parasponia andersonii]